MASPEADFESLRICADDYNNLLFKIRYIERLMFLRKNDLPFALKFISYLLFKSKDQKGQHGAVADARLTMLSYIYDFSTIEELFEDAITRYPIPRRKNYLGFRSMFNPRMSNLLKKYYKKYKLWPRDLLDKYQRRLIGNPVWNKNDYVATSRIGYPLAQQHL